MGASVIIDLSHYDTVVDFPAIKGSGIEAVIHKATEGTYFKDDKYTERKEEAKSKGLLWGAFHLATGEAADEQATYFLNFAECGDNDLIAIDCEKHEKIGKSVNVPDLSYTILRDLIVVIREKVGRLPVIYGGGSLLTEIASVPNDPNLNLCPLWFSDYPGDPGATMPTAPLPNAWDAWTMWQYAAGGAGANPRLIEGINAYYDRSTYNGTRENLLNVWPFT